MQWTTTLPCCSAALSSLSADIITEYPPFLLQCDRCDFAASARAGLNFHKKKCEKVNYVSANPFEFKCEFFDICGFAFSERAKLNAHKGRRTTLT